MEKEMTLKACMIIPYIAFAGIVLCLILIVVKGVFSFKDYRGKGRKDIQQSILEELNAIKLLLISENKKDKK